MTIQQTMTVKEMLGYTNRFKDIMAANSLLHIQNGRLANLMSDLEEAFGIPALRNAEYEATNPHVLMLYRTVSEARF